MAAPSAEELRRWYVDEGRSLGVVAMVFDVSRQTIRRWLEQSGIPVRAVNEGFGGRTHSLETKLLMSATRRHLAGTTYPEPTEALMRRLYLDERRSTSQIADQLGCSAQIVVIWLRNFGISQRRRGWAVAGERNPIYGQTRPPSVVASIRAKLTGRTMPEADRAKRRGQLVGEKNGRWGKPPPHGRGAWYDRKDGARVWLRSTYETRVASAFDALGLDWQYEPQRFILADRTYCPDFYVPAHATFYEVKGWFHERHQETVRQFRALNPLLRLIVLQRAEIVALERQVNRKAG